MDFFRTKKAAIGAAIIATAALIVAPVITIGTAVGSALGLGGGVLYSKDKPTGGGVYIAAATFAGGLIGGVTAGITSEFTDLAQADSGLDKQAHYTQVRPLSLEDIMNGSIEDKSGQAVQFTLAP
tara:strand:+ start:388 stop:762 length:375 start_codon:yes stop_codon:yes gene_type:complete